MLLTALNEDAVAKGYLDPAGLRILAESGFEIRSVRNLHAKFVLVDRDWGVVGGHENLPIDGHRISPLADTKPPQWRPSDLPTDD